jgi:hypothetical protein
MLSWRDRCCTCKLRWDVDDKIVDDRLLGYGVSYDWGRGHGEINRPVKLFIHPLHEGHVVAKIPVRAIFRPSSPTLPSHRNSG